MKICYFGIYNKDYSRNQILISGLRANGIEVIECSSDLSGIKKYFDLIKKHWKIRKDYDKMIVGFPGQQVMILAKFLTSKPIIFNVFVSLYDSVVLDRQELKPNSIKAKYFWFLDWLSSHLADKIILDTNNHIDYFVKNFNLNRDKFIRVFVGSNDKVLFPVASKEKQDDCFLVHFHGSMVPLQGVKYILGAVRLLEKENVRFNIIGTKIKNNNNQDEYKNVNFIDNVPYEKLKNYMAQADLCLGVFGDTKKAKRIIPNKVYEAIACAKPVITGDSGAITELFIENESITTCKFADEKDLAKKILNLKSNKDLRDKISQNAFSLFKNKLTPIKVVNNLLTKL